MTTAKAWAALVSMIVTSILASDIIPVSNKVHVVLTILGVIAGTFTTWRIPNATDTPVIPPSNTVQTK